MQISHSGRILDAPFPWFELFLASAVCLSGFFVSASSSIGCLFFLLAQNDSQALNVACHDGEGDVALETVNAMIGAFIQAMHAQRIDRRFDGRVLAAQADKFRVGFAGFVGFGQAAFFRQYDVVQALLELDLVAGAVKALVKAHGFYGWKAGLGLFDQRYGDLIVGGFFHNLMVQDKAILVFDDTHPQAQLDRYASFAYRDVGKGREQERKLFLC